MIFLFIISAALGYFLAHFLSGGKAGQEGILKSVIFTAGAYKVHLHHWFISVIILAILFIVQYYNNFIYGFLTGIIIQGLTYKDFYKIIYKK